MKGCGGRVWVGEERVMTGIEMAGRGMTPEHNIAILSMGSSERGLGGFGLITSVGCLSVSLAS